MLTGRFAPSPSGRMHLGNVFSALLAWLSVRSRGGRMLLRIEDLDPDRCRPEYAKTLKRDLDWLGLDWDAEQTPQSRRTEAYRAEFDKLAALGLVYPCYCSRAGAARGLRAARVGRHGRLRRDLPGPDAGAARGKDARACLARAGPGRADHGARRPAGPVAGGSGTRLR